MLVTKSNYKIKFEQALERYDSYSIIPHYNPDPDALGGAFALYHLLTKFFNKKCTIYFSGIIGRAENNTMIKILEIPVKKIDRTQSPFNNPVILIDTQPGTGNNPLKSTQKPYLIIDHHPLKNRSYLSRYADIRQDFGSSCSILFDYYTEFGIKPPVNVATALYYGIQTDVVGEGRTGYKIDFKYMEELSKYINREKLFAIENPKLPFDYYMHVEKGMKNGVIYNDFLISSLGEIENPDYIGEIADFLVRFDKAYLVLVIGIYKNFIQLSFRSQRKKIDAGEVLKKIVGRYGNAGGHASNAGGRIEAKDNDDIPKIIKNMITRALNTVQGKITSGVPFLSLEDYF